MAGELNAGLHLPHVLLVPVVSPSPVDDHDGGSGVGLPCGVRQVEVELVGVIGRVDHGDVPKVGILGVGGGRRGDRAGIRHRPLHGHPCVDLQRNGGAGDGIAAGRYDHIIGGHIGRQGRGDGVGGPGGPRDGRTVLAPLIGKRLTAGGNDAERDAVAEDGGLGDGLGQNGRIIFGEIINADVVQCGHRGAGGPLFFELPIEPNFLPRGNAQVGEGLRDIVPVIRHGAAGGVFVGDGGNRGPSPRAHVGQRSRSARKGFDVQRDGVGAGDKLHDGAGQGVAASPAGECDRGNAGVTAAAIGFGDVGDVAVGVGHRSSAGVIGPAKGTGGDREHRSRDVAAASRDHVKGVDAIVLRVPPTDLIGESESRDGGARVVDQTEAGVSVGSPAGIKSESAVGGVGGVVVEVLGNAVENRVGEVGPVHGRHRDEAGVTVGRVRDAIGSIPSRQRAVVRPGVGAGVGQAVETLHIGTGHIHRVGSGARVDDRNLGKSGKRQKRKENRPRPSDVPDGQTMRTH